MNSAPAAAPDPYRSLSGWAIKHPIIPTVLMLVLTLLGSVAFMRLNVNGTPNIDLPVVNVNIALPGAAPTDIETQITERIEDAVAGIGNINHIRSTISDGVSMTSIEFNLGINTDRAVNDVRDAIAKIRPDLPKDILEPVIQRLDVAGTVATYAVEAPSMSTIELSWFVDTVVSRALLLVPGVSQVTRWGGADREIRIDLDPGRLVALGVTAADVNRQVRALNVNLPGGRGAIGEVEQTIRTLGSAETLDDLSSARINLAGGRNARLADLGRISDGTAEPRQLARLDNRPVVALAIARGVGAGEVSVAEKIGDELDELHRTYPQVSFKLIVSTSRYVDAAYRASMEALYLGAVLAVLVVFLFLRDWRATLVTGVAMPLSIVPTFFVMYAAGFTINNVTMLGLTLVVGVLVDDAIVEVENIVRHIRAGRRPYRAALEAANEIGLAVIATTMTLVVVFLPVSFMGGIPGQYFREFGFTVAVAVLFSLLVARMVTPLMAAYLLQPHQRSRQVPRWVRLYVRVLRSALDHRVATVVIAVAIFAASIALLPLVPKGFIPDTDREQSLLTVELPPGATLEQTDATCRQIVDILRQDPSVSSVFVSIGSPPKGGALTAGEVRKADITVLLKPRRERSQSQAAFEAAAGLSLKAIPGIRYSFSMYNGTKGVSIVLLGEDAAALTRTASDVLDQMRTLPQVTNVNSTASLSRPEILIVPKLDRAAEAGISVEQISDTAKIAMIGEIPSNLAKFNLSTHQIPILVELDPKYRAVLATIEELRLSLPTGGSIPLKAVADLQMAEGAAQIERYDRDRQVTIEADLRTATLGQAMTAIRQLPALAQLPPGLRQKPAGNAELMQQVFSQFGNAIGAGVVMIYGVLVVLFRSFFQPVTILIALPLSVGGALLALLAGHDALSISGLIGILMLMGIVTKNSILLVEYTIVAMHEGVQRREALLDAASKRAQPIVMTTIAMIAGMVPIALRLGADAEFRGPMAIAVIGGLSASTLLSLCFVPVMFTLIDDLQRHVTRPLRGLITGPTDDIDGRLPHSAD